LLANHSGLSSRRSSALLERELLDVKPVARSVQRIYLGLDERQVSSLDLEEAAERSPPKLSSILDNPAAITSREGFTVLIASSRIT